MPEPSTIKMSKKPGQASMKIASDRKRSTVSNSSEVKAKKPRRAAPPASDSGKSSKPRQAAPGGKRGMAAADPKKQIGLPDAELKQRVLGIRWYLTRIASGTIFSSRHQEFQRGGASRRFLDHDCGLNKLRPGQEDLVTDLLLSMFACRGQLQSLDYLLRVLLPEAIAKVFDTGKMSHIDRIELCH